MKKITIEVTQQDIDASERQVPERCAIATACKRLGFDRPYVGPDDDGFWVLVDWSRDGSQPNVRLPLEAVEFAEKFDLGDSVKPITFDIYVRE